MLPRWNWKLCVGIVAGLHAVGGLGGLSSMDREDRHPGHLNQYMKDPDAVGEMAIPGPSGFDLSRTWPGVPQSGWKARIAIKADVPFGDDKTKFFTVSRLSLVPPDGVDIMSNDTSDYVSTDTSWYPCTALWRSPILDASSADDVHGSCSESLPRQCVNDLQHQLETVFFGGWNGGGNLGHCIQGNTPDSCINAVGQGVDLFTSEPHNHALNYMDLNRFYDYDRRDAHNKGDTEYYDAALKRVWIMGTMFGYSYDSMLEHSSDDTTNATLACIRAHEVDGSDTSGGDGDTDTDTGDDGDSVASRMSYGCLGTNALAVAITVSLSLL